MYSKLFEPWNLGPLVVKNRIVMPPMVVGYAGPHGEVTEQIVAYYEARARGGVGLIIVEATSISPEGKAVLGELGIYEDSLIPGLTKLADAIKVHGAIAAIQLIHGGIQAKVPEPVGPSSIGRTIIPPTKTPRELSTREVEELVEKFAAAALRAMIAGFDAVEVHGTHGYLITQFLSPLTNKRSDKYGADRTLFAKEIIERIKEKCGRNYPVIFRLAADEFIGGGITLEEAKRIARILEDTGVDAFDVTGGNYDTVDYIIQPYYYAQEEGFFFKLAKEIKSVVSVPVISGGLITTPEVAERAIAEGIVDAVFIGRQLIADPEWPRKVMEGRVADIRPCQACNEGCIGRLFTMKPVWCTVNPLNSWEYRWITEETIPKAHVKKRVLVIGGGPAGMEAARVAALRGHEVILVEKNEKLGGTLKIASVPLFKKRLEKLVKWYEAQLGKLGVKVITGRTVDEEFIRDLRPDVVILATGSKPIIPKIPGVENAVVADEVLAGRASVGERVVIIGGGLVGVETALWLAMEKKCKEIILVEALEDIARDLEPVSKIALTRPRGPWPEGLLYKYGIRVYTNTPAVEIKKDGIVVLKEGLYLEEIKADTVILAVGRVSNLDEKLVETIKKYTKEVYIIGDAKAPRKIIDAIHEGFFTALNI